MGGSRKIGADKGKVGIDKYYSVLLKIKPKIGTYKNYSISIQA
jgi:hypothetical protein